MDDPLIWARAVHFLSTVLLSGTVLFVAFVAEPAFRKAGKRGALRAIVWVRLLRLAWTSSALVLVTGVAWFIWLTASIADVPPSEIFSDGAGWTVLTQTGFGHDWGARFLLLASLAGAMLWWSRLNSRLAKFICVPLAAALVATLAWAGHGAAGLGAAGAVHLASDVLHLIAAAAWVGALVPLALLLAAAGRTDDELGVATAHVVVQRFSTLGMVSVGTLLTTGVINSWILVGSVAALLGTHYGRLLQLKIGLFLLMLSIAAVNRHLLTPRLMRAPRAAGQRPIQQLRNNSLVEAGLGALILAVVGILGVLPPGVQELAAQ